MTESMADTRADLSADGAAQRYQALTQWVQTQQLKLGLQAGPNTQSQPLLTSLHNDAGFRRYYRIQGMAGIKSGVQLLAVDAPPATEDTTQFVAVAEYLRQAGVRTPKIFALDEVQGFLLVEDFGEQLLQNSLQPSSVDKLYQEALTTLLTLQQSPDNPSLIPRYEQALLRRELLIFDEWFVAQLLGYSLTPSEHTMLDNVFSLLEASALEQPQVLVHRDYHSRNLLCGVAGGLGVIDFQGALWGPCTYDPVSLLRDCYVRWPEQQVRAWALHYYQLALTAGILPPVDNATYLRWFDWMGLQRHIKVLGIFARLFLRDNKPHYLADLTRVLGYVLTVADRYPELATFSHWLHTRILPIVEQQAWYIVADLNAGQTP